jgi:hypothetical protein
VKTNGIEKRTLQQTYSMTAFWFLTKETNIRVGGKIFSSTNVAGKTGFLLAEDWNFCKVWVITSWIEWNI